METTTATRHNAKAVAVRATVTLDGELRIFGDVTPVELSCGHLRLVAPHFSVRDGDYFLCPASADDDRAVRAVLNP